MENRESILKKLILLEGNIKELQDQLALFVWDMDHALIKLDKFALVSALQKRINGEISLDILTNWANTIECRDDIEFESVQIQEIIYELANTEINGQINKKRLKEIISSVNIPT